MTAPFMFSVRGTPRPLPRGRHVKGRVVSIADPKARLWRLAVDRAVRRAIADRGHAAPLFRGAVRLSCTFTFEPPAAAQDRIGKPHTHKPDASNLLKLVEDVMESAGVFANDCQVSQAVPRKEWGSPAGVSVLVEDASDVAPAPRAARAPAPNWLTNAQR